MNLFVCESSDGHILLKKQYLYSLQYYSANTIVQHMKSLYYPNLDKLEHDLFRFVSQFLTHPFASSPADDTSHHFLPSKISNLMFQLVLEARLPPPLFLALARYLFHSMTQLALHVLHAHEVFTFINTSTITTFDFSNNISINDSLFTLLTSSTLVFSIKHINLSRCTKFENFQSLSQFSSLQSLDLSENYNLAFQFPQCLLCRLLSMVSAFTRLVALDLHMTNLILETLRFEECSEPTKWTHVIESCQLQHLNLYTMPKSDFHDSFLHFYDMLLGLKYLDYLDISGWPSLIFYPKTNMVSLSKGKSFFGVYFTGLMDQWGDRNSLLSQETSGFADEEQLISTLQHYYSEKSYMEKFLYRFAHLLVNNEFALTTGSINILAECLHKTILHYFGENPLGSYCLINSLSCLATSLGHAEADLSTVLAQRVLECCALILHSTHIDDIARSIICSHMILNCMINVEKLMHLDLFHHKLSSTHHVFHKISTDIIRKGTEQLRSSSITPTFLELVQHTLSFIKIIFLKSDCRSQALFGSRYEGVDVLMRYVSAKLELGQLREDVSEACGALMNATYLCYSNCLVVSSQHNSHTLRRVLEKNSEVECIMGILENVAEFCLQFESAFAVFNILPALKAILTTSSKRSPDTLACSIATLIYLATGKEKWGWKDGMGDIDSLLSTTIATILTMNYKEKRFVTYSTLEYLFQCLATSDSRIHHCALWILANLMFSNPELYFKMVDMDSLSKIKSFVVSHTKASPIHILAETLLDLYKIGSYVRQ